MQHVKKKIRIAIQLSKFALSSWNRYSWSVVHRWLPAQADVVWGEDERYRVEGLQQIQSERYFSGPFPPPWEREWSELHSGACHVCSKSLATQKTHLEFSFYCHHTPHWRTCPVTKYILTLCSLVWLCSEFHTVLTIIADHIVCTVTVYRAYIFCILNAWMI